MNWQETVSEEKVAGWVGGRENIKIRDMLVANMQAQATWEARQPEVDEAEQRGIRKVIPFAEKFLDVAEHGDYSNGIEAFGIDEGRVRAKELLDNLKKEWQAFLKGVEKSPETKRHSEQ